MMLPRRRHRQLARVALVFAFLAWLVSAASLACGRPLLHKAMHTESVMAMTEGAASDQHNSGGDCEDRPCLEYSQLHDLAQGVQSDGPQLLAVLVLYALTFIVGGASKSRVKLPDPPDLKPIPLFQRYCVLRN